MLVNHIFAVQALRSGFGKLVSAHGQPPCLDTTAMTRASSKKSPWLARKDQVRLLQLTTPLLQQHLSRQTASVGGESCRRVVFRKMSCDE